MRISVVINTCNRGNFIGNTLDALRYQTFKDFEVIVVNGPSTDNTAEVVQRYKDVRYYKIPEYNISVSRNVGIRYAAGEIIAFIDDDGIPEPHWLADLHDAYADENVGAAGGFVFNDTGDDYQFCYGMINVWGYALTRRDKPFEYNTPYGNLYNINIGTNSSFRREYLIEIGGFDEEIEYYHDESDVCLRLINAGYKVIQLPKAFIHHKYAQSSRRQANKKVVDWDSIVKNTIYFGIKNSAGVKPLYLRLIKPFLGEFHKFKSLRQLLVERDYSIPQFLYKNLTLVQAFVRGYYRGFFQSRKFIKSYSYNSNRFRKYTVFEGGLNLALVTQGYPPNHTDGISRYNNTLARELARLGHTVYVITRSDTNQDRIEYRDSVWIYEYNASKFDSHVTDYGGINRLVSMSKASFKTLFEINKREKIDLTLAPLFDLEGLVHLRKRLTPVIITLMTPLKKVVETQWYNNYHESMEIVYQLEKECVEQADGIMSISAAIKDTFAEMYGIDWNTLEQSKPVEVIPLAPEPVFKRGNRSDDGKIRILFTGRFERRKGIDLLLSIIPNIMQKHENVYFDFSGDDTIFHEGKINYKNDFLDKNSGADWLERLSFHGYTTDEQLAELYSNCDIFVAPSRYESFGIILLEAMASGKPIIATRVGGMPEILHDKQNGLLFENENSEDLLKKLLYLIENDKVRIAMGNRSLQLVKEKFMPEILAKSFEALGRRVLSNREKTN